MLVIPRAAAEQLLLGEPETLRVYLYGLLHEESEPEQVSEALGMERGVLLQAMETLQAQGLLQLGSERCSSLSDTAAGGAGSRPRQYIRMQALIICCRHCSAIVS